MITPAWFLDEMRADYPSQLVKLSKGENICLQDTMHSYTFIIIPFAYLDLQRAPGEVYSSTLGQQQVGTSNVHVHSLLEGEEEMQEDKNERVLNNSDAVAQQWVSELTML